MPYRRILAPVCFCLLLVLACWTHTEAIAEDCLEHAPYAPWSARIETGGKRGLVERLGAVTILGEQSGRLRFIENIGTAEAQVLREEQLPPVMCISASDTFVFVSCDYDNSGDFATRQFRIYSLADPGNIRLLQTGSMRISFSYPYYRTYYALDCVFHGPFMVVSAYNDYSRCAIWLFELNTQGVFVEQSFVLVENTRGLACSGQYCYVAKEDTGLQWYDLFSTPPLTLAGTLAWTNIAPEDVAVLGNFLYVGGSYGDLVCCYIGSGQAPEWHSTTPVGAGAMSLVPGGPDRLFVADRGIGAYAVDVSNPVGPVVVGRMSAPGGARDLVVDADDNVAATTDAGLCFRNLAEPKPDALVRTSPFLSWAACRANGLLYSGYGDSLRIYDLDGAGRWQRLGAVATDDPPAAIYPHGNFIFCATQFFVLSYGGCLLDVSDPRRPVVKTYFEHECDDVAFADNYMYVSHSTVEVYDLSTQPVIARVGAQECGAGKIEVDGDLAYMGVNSTEFPARWGLKIYSVTNPREFQVLGSLALPNEVEALAVRDGLAYVMTGSELRILDVGDPAVPVLVGSTILDNVATDMLLDGNRAYVSTSRGIAFLDVSDPANPVQLGGALGGWTSQISMDGGVLSTWMNYRAVDLMPFCSTSTPNFLSHFVAAARGAVVEISWELIADGAAPPLKLTGRRGTDSWPVPYVIDAGGHFRASDNSSQVAAGGDIRYVLEVRGDGDRWGMLGETLVRDLPGLAPGISSVKPNPFNAEAVVEYRVRQAAPVMIRVFDLRGRRVATVVDEWREGGTHLARWNARDDAGRDVSSGTYCLRFECGATTQSIRISLVK